MTPGVVAYRLTCLFLLVCLGVVRRFADDWLRVCSAIRDGIARMGNLVAVAGENCET
jgi:hypothetical protein